jgi:hypothetical protein
MNFPHDLPQGTLIRHEGEAHPSRVVNEEGHVVYLIHPHSIACHRDHVHQLLNDKRYIAVPSSAPPAGSAKRSRRLLLL